MEHGLEQRVKAVPAGGLLGFQLADAVLFLAGRQAQMICGQTIVVDGGFSLLV